MFHFQRLDGFLYVGDFLFLASLATIIIKLKLEKSSLGFSAKTQGVYGVVLCTRNIDLLFVEDSALYLIYAVFKKITNISCIIYIVFKIKSTSKNNTTCNCNQDSFWVEALVLPCIIITAIFHYGASPEEVLWSFSTYLETLAMLPQLYLIQVRGKGDSYLPAYISLMASYSFTDALVYCLNAFMYDNMPTVWPSCKCIQLIIYIWYIFIPREAVMPVANCTERKRKTTVFMRQQSMLAQALLTKNNSSNDLQVFAITSPKASPSPSLCSSTEGASLDGGLNNPSITECSTPLPTPCIKFNIGLDSESIRLKAPISLNTIKQLKNKGTLKLSSLPSTPEFSRKSDLMRSSSTTDFFRPKNDFMQFDTALSQRAKRIKRGVVSMPTSPESEVRSPPSFLSPSFTLLNRSISQIYGSLDTRKKKRVRYSSNLSLQTTPKLSHKSELILRIPSLSSSESIYHQTLTLNRKRKIYPNRPPLPKINGSPAYIKKNDHINVEIEPTSNDLISLKPERPPFPQNITSDKTTPEDPNLCKNSYEVKTTCIPLEPVHTSQLMHKPKRPALPKLIISAPETAN